MLRVLPENLLRYVRRELFPNNEWKWLIRSRALIQHRHRHLLVKKSYHFSNQMSFLAQREYDQNNHGKFVKHVITQPSNDFFFFQESPLDLSVRSSVSSTTSGLLTN